MKKRCWKEQETISIRLNIILIWCMKLIDVMILWGIQLLLMMHVIAVWRSVNILIHNVRVKVRLISILGRCKYGLKCLISKLILIRKLKKLLEKMKFGFRHLIWRQGILPLLVILFRKIFLNKSNNGILGQKQFKKNFSLWNYLTKIHLSLPKMI